MGGLEQVRTIAEWGKERGDDRPAPFELFFVDPVGEAALRYDEPGRFDGNWLLVRVRKQKLGNAFDLEVLDALIHGPAAVEHVEGSRNKGEGSMPSMLGTGLFRAFLKEAERLADANFFSAVAVVGVGDVLLQQALVRNGYRCFAAGSFRKIVRPLSRPRRDFVHLIGAQAPDAQLASLV